jgi:hypothetical protein
MSKPVSKHYQAAPKQTHMFVKLVKKVVPNQYLSSIQAAPKKARFGYVLM